MANNNRRIIIILICILLFITIYIIYQNRSSNEIDPPANAYPPESPNITIQKAPIGFASARGTKPEPYSNSGWAYEIVHEKAGIELIFIPSGEFHMGSPEDEEFDEPRERPLHHVTIDKPFYMSKYEITQGQWNLVMGTTIAEQRDKADPSFPLRGEGDDFPMYYISWHECIEFTERAGHGLRLPTEAEWEYACRAGTTTSYFFGDSITTKQVNHRPHPRRFCLFEHKPRLKSKGSYTPNSWGLYDMHGSVWEWCQSLYKVYPYSEHDNREDLDAEGERVIRGGSWADKPWYCRSATRYARKPQFRDSPIGFRIVLEIVE